MPKKAYDEIPTEQWSANHLRDYLYAKHEEILGVKYVARNFAVDTRMLKNFAATNGIAVTKRFIDLCLSKYRPNSLFPGINFGFMQTYMKERYLPHCLKAEDMAQIIEGSEENNAVDLDWL